MQKRIKHLPGGYPPNRFQRDCVGLTWQSFGSTGAAGVISARRDQELPLCLTKTVPPGFKVEPPLAKAELSSNSAGTSVITYFRKSEKYWTAAV